MRSEFITWQTLPISDAAVRMRLTTGDLIMIHRDDLHLGVVGLCNAQKAPKAVGILWSSIKASPSGAP